VSPFFGLNDILAGLGAIALLVAILPGSPWIGLVGALAPGLFLPWLRERDVKVGKGGFLMAGAVALLGFLCFLVPYAPWLPSPSAPLSSPVFILWCLAAGIAIPACQRPVECWKTILCEYAGLAVLIYVYRTAGGWVPDTGEELLSARYMFPMGLGLGLVIIGQIFHDPVGGRATGALTGRASEKDAVVSLGGIEWSIRDFVRGWLITGITGSGKTAAAIKTMMIQVFRNRPDWGGCVVDEKGSFHEIVREIAVKQGHGDKLIVLQVRPEGAPAEWRPKNRYNILSYPGLPAPAYAKLIADTASAVTGKGDGDKAFFKVQALAQISAGIALLELTSKVEGVPRCRNVRLNRLYDTVSSATEARRAVEKVSHVIYHRFGGVIDQLYSQILPPSVQATLASQVESAITNIRDSNEKRGRQMAMFQPTDPRNARKLPFHPIVVEAVLAALDSPTCPPGPKSILSPEEQEILTMFHKVGNHFNDRFLCQPPDQLGGVTSTIDNYLRFFQSPAIAETFCAEENTVEFSDIDKGMIFVISMPQVYAVERQYLNTIFKLLFYTHALRRFDQPPEIRRDNNLLIFWADEAQGVVTASDGGMEDYSVVDKTREALATVVFATQSTTSFIPKISDKKTEVLMLNLANRVFFGCADDRAAEMAAKTIGKSAQKKRDGYSSSSKGSNVSYKFIDEFIFKPHELRALRKFEAVISHCEKGCVRAWLPPVEADGSVSKWFKKGG
jgi:hypothetical protein